MNELENLNKRIKINYFDKNNDEEDLPLQINKNKQDYYAELDNIFEIICNDITVENAEVKKKINKEYKLFRKD